MIRTCILSLALGAAAALVAAPAAAEDAATWDQAAATAAATSFQQTVNEIRRSITLQDGGIQARQNKTFLVAEDLRTLERFSGRLVRQLAAGETREQTEPLFTRTLRIVDRLRATMPAIPAFAKHVDQIRVAREQLDILAPMYNVVLPAPVAAPGESN